MHQSTIKNRTIFCCDNLVILQGINSNSIDLVYLDPPFNKGKVFSAPGNRAEGLSFSDIFRKKDIRDDWLQTIKEDAHTVYHILVAVQRIGYEYTFCYLAYMAIRLLECHRVLKKTGSVYLHCDPTMSHYLKILLDCLFGESNFRNEIVWAYRTGGVSKRYFPRKHDIILSYGKSARHAKHFPMRETTEYTKPFFLKPGVEPTAPGVYPVDVYVRDVWEAGVKPVINVSKERVGYPTQKPLALLERIIKTGTDQGDVVLDPFCGSATACLAAERLGRQWIGVDVSVRACDLVRNRLTRAIAPAGGHRDTTVHYTTTPPDRTDAAAGRPLQKHVYVLSHPGYPGEYTVGIAKDCQARLNAYQSADPTRAYQLEYAVLTPWFRETERYIHKTFDHKHDWVRADLPKIIHAIECCQAPSARFATDTGL